MAGIDPWLIIDILALLGAVLAIILAVYWLLWLDKKYGFPEAPDEVESLRKEIKSGPLAIDLMPYVFDRELNDRKTYKRSFDTNDGHWVLTVEIEEQSVVAFQAVLSHNKSWLMGRTVEDWNKYPKIIQPYGCG